MIFLKGFPLKGVNGGSGQIGLRQFQYDSRSKVLKDSEDITDAVNQISYMISIQDCNS